MFDHQYREIAARLARIERLLSLVVGYEQIEGELTMATKDQVNKLVKDVSDTRGQVDSPTTNSVAFAIRSPMASRRMLPRRRNPIRWAINRNPPPRSHSLGPLIRLAVHPLRPSPLIRPALPEASRAHHGEGIARSRSLNRGRLQLY
jgi:hypothetical protein